MLIDGIAIGGYRSFGELQHIAPCRKVNLFIGPNNVGKSNILRFIQAHSALARHGGNDEIHKADLDNHRGDEAAFCFGWGRRADYGGVQKVLARIRDHLLRSHAQTLVKSVLRNECVWAYRVLRKDSEKLAESPKQLKPDELWNESGLENHWAEQLRQGLDLPRSLGTGEFVTAFINAFEMFNDKAPDVAVVPAFRQVLASDTEPDFGRAGLIQRLADLQDPDHDEMELRIRFDEIQNFLRSVVGNSTAILHVPAHRKHTNVEIDGRRLPLHALGTGIHEVVILAAAATVLENSVVCMEEPEIHLHPILQRKFVRYLAGTTSNQYFIATHSAHLIDCPAATVFRVSLEDGQSRVRQVVSSGDKWNLCRDLGYRASDIMQANCVIWVEGPSDRIYLNHWIRAKTADLIEGVHYQIMFYGGRLLNHLSAEDPEVTEFISLCSINRNVVVVIDRDREDRLKRINKTKQRVVEEVARANGLSWVTDGREIENYVPPDGLRECVEVVKPGFGNRVDTDEFANALKIKQDGEPDILIDKLKVAHAVAERPADLSRLDLEQQIDKLIESIGDANR